MIPRVCGTLALLLLLGGVAHSAQLDRDYKGKAQIIANLRLNAGSWTSLATEPRAYGFRSEMVVYLPLGEFHVFGAVVFSAQNAGSSIQLRADMPIVEIDQSNDIDHAPAAPIPRSVMGSSVVGTKDDFKTKAPGLGAFEFDFGDVACEADVAKMQMCELTLSLWTDDSDARVLGNSFLQVEKSAKP